MSGKFFDVIENFQIICCIYGKNFIDFGENFKKFYILSETGQRELMEREREIDTRGEVVIF